MSLPSHRQEVSAQVPRNRTPSQVPKPPPSMGYSRPMVTAWGVAGHDGGAVVESLVLRVNPEDYI